MDSVSINEDLTGDNILILGTEEDIGTLLTVQCKCGTELVVEVDEIPEYGTVMKCYPCTTCLPNTYYQDKENGY